MTKYNPQKIEKKWQDSWEKSGLYHGKDESNQLKFYCLDMFPYPSGEGLHVGHWRGYVLSDVIARYQMLNGQNVLHPMGYDAFGLPAENAAIKAGSHPSVFTNKAIDNFRRQIKQIGTMIDWTREVKTSDSSYYKWTQWLFLKLYKNGLAYRKKAPVNWCPSCQTVLANEQVVSGECERCGSKVIKKDLTQWFFKITEFADDLLNDLEGLDWPDRVKHLQKNWIGKSEGALVEFKIHNSEKSVKVFTTRIDTLAGATFVVLAPEHELVSKITTPEQKKEIDEYIDKSRKESDIEREKTNKEKTGVFTGAYAINPITKKQIPIWIADYALLSYGTGAVMCVPAHDERDYFFAKKFELPILQVIAPHYTTSSGDDAVRKDKPTVKRKMITAIVKHWKDDKIFVLDWEKFNWHSFILGGVEDGEKADAAVKREVNEESGYSDIKSIRKIGFETHSNFFARHKDVNRYSMSDCYIVELSSDKYSKPEVEHTKNHKGQWLDSDEVGKFVNLNNNQYYWEIYQNGEKAFIDDGVLINSGEYSGLSSKEAKRKIVEDLLEEGVAESAINFRLRDWLISRQRYWGAPIPIVYCKTCGEVAVSEKDLPVKLPEDVEFKPHGDSPLKQSKDFLNVKCPSCGEKATRETDTMDTFVDSSWYYLRYTDPRNDEMIAESKKINSWMPVDFYVGGIEHAVLHLLYARFISKALTKIGVLNFSENGEPFTKLYNIGMIYLHGKKMSKSKGNIVSPDELIEKYGTDALRGYELFIGPADQDSQWQIQGITGIFRFLEKVWNYYGEVKPGKDNEDAYIEKTIKTITFEIEEIRPNTAISHLMELFNYLKGKNISENYLGKINILLSPFFPHLAEELWEIQGHKDSIFKEKWPTFDENLVKSEKYKVAIQINGKVKAVIEIDSETSQEQVEKIAKESLEKKKALQGAAIKKVIYVPCRVLNFVLK